MPRSHGALRAQGAGEVLAVFGKCAKSGVAAPESMSYTGHGIGARMPPTGIYRNRYIGAPGCYFFFGPGEGGGLSSERRSLPTAAAKVTMIFRVGFGCPVSICEM